MVSSEPSSPGVAPRQALEKGEISLQGQFLLGSNYTFLVTVQYEGRGYEAVYKPMRGEQPLWDFPPASLAGREVAAHELCAGAALRVRAHHRPAGRSLRTRLAAAVHRA